jgi:hypothetical protein
MLIIAFSLHCVVNGHATVAQGNVDMLSGSLLLLPYSSTRPIPQTNNQGKENDNARIGREN